MVMFYLHSKQTSTRTGAIPQLMHCAVNSRCPNVKAPKTLVESEIKTIKCCYHSLFLWRAMRHCIGNVRVASQGITMYQVIVSLVLQGVQLKSGPLTKS